MILRHQNKDQIKVSYCIFAFNQEEFISDALEGILLQSYKDVELIISDDCSTDSTYEIIKSYRKKLSKFSNTIINKNNVNLGLIKHFNKVINMCSGELIIVQAGDDIAAVDRILENIKFWKENNNRFSVFCSNYYLINKNKKILNNNFDGIESISIKDFPITNVTWQRGCTMAFSKRIYDLFGDIDERSYAEDKIIGLRGLLLNKEIGFLNKNLLYYRMHENNLSNMDIYSRTESKINNIEAARSDLKTFFNKLSSDNQENRTGRELINIFDNEISKSSKQLVFLNMNIFKIAYTLYFNKAEYNKFSFFKIIKFKLSKYKLFIYIATFKNKFRHN